MKYPEGIGRNCLKTLERRNCWMSRKGVGRALPQYDPKNVAYTVTYLATKGYLDRKRWNELGESTPRDGETYYMINTKGLKALTGDVVDTPVKPDTHRLPQYKQIMILLKQLRAEHPECNGFCRDEVFLAAQKEGINLTRKQCGAGLSNLKFAYSDTVVSYNKQTVKRGGLPILREYGEAYYGLVGWNDEPTEAQLELPLAEPSKGQPDEVRQALRDLNDCMDLLGDSLKQLMALLGEE